MPYQDGVGAAVAIILFLSVVEIVVMDLLLDTLWVRIVVAAAGVAAGYLLIGFFIALSAYPHRVTSEALTVRYGAAFEVAIGMGLVAEARSQRRGGEQRRTAEVIDGVLSVPVMGVTNMLVKLDAPVEMELHKEVSAVHEIRMFAVDPAEAVRMVQGSADGPDPEAASAPPATAAAAATQVPLWLRRLRWAGLLVLLVEIALVTTGLLDWRIAAGILAVTEGTLAVLGVIFGAAFVTQYRKLRRAGEPRSEAFSQSLFSLMPPPMAGLVRREMSIFRVIALAVARRTERQQPGDVPLKYGRAGRRALAITAVLLAAAGILVLAMVSHTLTRYLVGIVLLYSALLTAALASASTVRPHLRRGDDLHLRWGLHHELVVPVETVREVGIEPAKTPRQRPSAPEIFAVPCPGREELVLHFTEPIEVPTRLGSQRPATSIVLPLDNSEAACEAISRAMEEGRRADADR
ncbi:hypothetical protein ABZW18_26390 [Streptomyces sp. NPDC004647]|uniref:hypothetical protein n=1 Tax=Streptomyces sp. NPDC004647 TaxID=3154671 RepID=UPI0033AEE300